MSLYYAQKLIYQLNRDPAIRKRFDQDFESLLADYELTKEERDALRKPGVAGGHWRLGVHRWYFHPG